MRRATREARVRVEDDVSDLRPLVRGLLATDLRADVVDRDLAAVVRVRVRVDRPFLVPTPFFFRLLLASRTMARINSSFRIECHPWIPRFLAI